MLEMSFVNFGGEDRQRFLFVVKELFVGRRVFDWGRRGFFIFVKERYGD